MIPINVRLSDNQIDQMANDTLLAIADFEKKNGRKATKDEKLEITAAVQRTYGLNPRFLDKQYDPTIGLDRSIDQNVYDAAATVGNFITSTATSAAKTVSDVAKAAAENTKETFRTAVLLAVVFGVLYIVVNKKG